MSLKICTTCAGSGLIGEAEGDQSLCPECDGLGSYDQPSDLVWWAESEVTLEGDSEPLP